METIEDDIRQMFRDFSENRITDSATFGKAVYDLYQDDPENKNMIAYRVTGEDSVTLQLAEFLENEDQLSRLYVYTGLYLLAGKERTKLKKHNIKDNYNGSF